MMKEKSCDRLYRVTPHRAQQMIGAERGRNLIRPDLLIRAWQWKVDNLEFSMFGRNVVPNEIEAAKEIGRTTVIRLSRDGARTQRKFRIM
jgi:hypothetical protein